MSVQDAEPVQATAKTNQQPVQPRQRQEQPVRFPAFVPNAMNPVIHDARDLLVAELHSIQCCILPIAVEQFLMRAGFDNTSGVKNDDAIGLFHC